MSNAVKGCLIQGVGYILPPKSKTHDGSGKRIKYMAEHATSLAEYARLNNGRVSASSRDELYHDPAIICDEGDIIGFGLVGQPLCVEHDIDYVIGNVVNASIHQGKVLITAQVTDPNWVRDISSGEFDYKSFSISYNFINSGSYVKSKSFREISIVADPFFENCHIEIYASKNDPKYTGDKNENIVIVKCGGEGTFFSFIKQSFLKIQNTLFQSSFGIFFYLSIK